jgi:hypothetical protein
MRTLFLLFSLSDRPTCCVFTLGRVAVDVNENVKTYPFAPHHADKKTAPEGAAS